MMMSVDTNLARNSNIPCCIVHLVITMYNYCINFTITIALACYHIYYFQAHVNNYGKIVKINDLPLNKVFLK